MRNLYSSVIVVGVGVLMFLPAVNTSVQELRNSRFTSSTGAAPQEANSESNSGTVHALQMAFVENTGQIEDNDVRFYLKTFGVEVFVTTNGDLTYLFPQFKNEEIAGGWVLKERFLGASVEDVRGREAAGSVVNYFRGRDPGGWRHNVPNWKVVSLGEIYPGIQLDLKVSSENVEKLLRVEEGGDPERVKVEIQGAKNLSVDRQGRLEIATELGVVRFTQPKACQEVNGKRRQVDIRYLVNGDQYSFEIGSYDKTKPLTIDPLLASTFIGGSSGDFLYAMALDSLDNVYVTGMVWSSDYPTTPGTYDTTHNGGNTDVFVSKLTSGLDELLASTFIGGSGVWERAMALNFDSFGNVYIAGYTESSNFPTTPGSYDTTYNGGSHDAFISKLNADLTALLASTFIGGGYWEYARSLTVDRSGNVYISGDAYSGYPTTPGAYDPSHNGISDAFVTKLNGNLSTLLASTFIGGSEWDIASTPLLLDLSGNVYVGGWTWSSNYPTTSGAYDSTYNGGNTDMFVSKLDGDLGTLLASTFIGGTDYEEAHALAFHPSGDVYVAGNGYSSDYPTTPGAYDTTHGGYDDMFVSRLDNNLTSLLSSTYLGGSYGDYCGALAVDQSGNVYVAGYGYSTDYPTTPGAYDTTPDEDTDLYVSKLDQELRYLLASTYIGGNDKDNYPDPPCMVLDSSGNVCIAGYTLSSDYPTTAGTYDESYNGQRDIFVTKIDSDLSAVGIEETESLPAVFHISCSKPNPFVDWTAVVYQLAVPCNMRIVVHNLLGQEVRTLVKTEQKVGLHRVVWNATDNAGIKVRSGTYFLRLQAEEYTATSKLVLVK